MTDQISFPPLHDLQPGELENRKQHLLREITRERERSRLSLSAFTLPRLRSPRARWAAALAAIAALSAAASVPVLLGSSDAGSSPSHSVVPSTGGGFGPAKGVPASSIAVSGVKAANDLLPFKAVLPSNATPTQMQVADPKQTSASEAWLSAQFDTSDNGSYQLFERASNDTIATLESWAQNSASCSGCTVDQVVTEDGVHVLVLASPVLGLQLYWIRGDGSSPVLNQLVWTSDTFSQQTALSVAGDIISQSG